MTDIKLKRKPFNGYYRSAKSQENQELTHTGPGTPAGEYFRRFWQPVAMVEQVGELPIALEILGEELVLFRDLGGQLGLLHKHCSHRRASLEYGIISEKGIRCCYHGWLFDVDGTILEVPGEPENSPIPKKLCHGAYPVREYEGLVFAWMGPPDEMADFPLFDTLKQSNNELIPYSIDYPCNWLQVAENPMDPFHSVFLHTRVTRAHFNPAWGAMPVVEWHNMDDNVGIFLTNTRRWKEFLWVRTAEIFLPAIAQPPDIYQNAETEKFFPRVGITKWTVPVNDTHCRIIAWRHFNETLDLDGRGDRSKVGLGKVDFVGQTGTERTYEEGQRLPGDYEAQISQGEITIHADEMLGRTDVGVVGYRKLLKEAIRANAAGATPKAPKLNVDGVIPTLAGDVIVAVPEAEADVALQREAGKVVGEIVKDTLALSWDARPVEIEKRVKAWVATSPSRLHSGS